jgi:S-adenosylmethionine hydrolase
VLVPGILPLSDVQPGRVVAQVLWIDRFGNAQLNVAPEEVEDLGDRVSVRLDGLVRTAVRADAYAELPPGGVGLVVDSYGLLSLALDRRSAAEELGLSEGDEVVLEEPPDQEGSTRVSIAPPTTRGARP